MSSLGRVCVAGCFWLVAAASALGVAHPAGIDMSDTDAAADARSQPSAPAQDQRVAQTGQPPSGNPLWGIPLKQLSATRDRPIFSPSRRPPPAAIPVTAVATSLPVQAPKQPERPQLSLIGTIVSGDDGFAIFVDQTTKAPLRIKLGAGYQGWMLRQIEARSVTLQKGEEVVMLSFPEPATGQNTPAGAGFAKTWPDPPAPLPPLASTAQTTPPFLSPESNALRMPARPRGGSARRRQM
jgi:general secretion pathway protein N